MSKSPTRASSPAAVVCGHAVVVRGRHEVGADQAVGGRAADREAAGQQPERPGPGRGAPARRRARAAAPPVAGGAGDDLGRAVGGQAEIRRVFAQQPHHQGYDRQRGPGHDERRRTPAVVADQHGEQRQEDQLTGRPAGGEHPGDQAPRRDEPAPGDGGHEGQRHRAGAQPDQHAPAEDQLPAGAS